MCVCECTSRSAGDRGGERERQSGFVSASRVSLHVLRCNNRAYAPRTPARVHMHLQTRGEGCMGFHYLGHLATRWVRINRQRGGRPTPPSEAAKGFVCLRVFVDL